MLVVTVAFEVSAAKADPFLAAVVANAKASLASEPGCRQFDVAVDPANAGAISIARRSTCTWPARTSATSMRWCPPGS